MSVNSFTLLYTHAQCPRIVGTLYAIHLKMTYQKAGNMQLPIIKKEKEMVLKALVVDDDKMILDILEYILESEGYDITRATDGDLAIKVLDHELFDLVVTDLQMGSTSGFDVIRKTKDINPNTIVVMISGSCDSLNEIEAFHQGADEYSVKPFSPKDLLARVQFHKTKQFFTSALTLESEQSAGKV